MFLNRNLSCKNLLKFNFDFTHAFGMSFKVNFNALNTCGKPYVCAQHIGA